MPTDQVNPSQGIVIELGFTETSFAEVVAKLNQVANESAGLQVRVNALEAQIEDGGVAPSPSPSPAPSPSPSPSPAPSPSPTPAPAPGTPDTRPGWFAAPADAASNGTAAFITGRTLLANSANGGKAGNATLTTSGSNYAWFAVAAPLPAPTFRNDDSGLAGGFSAQGTSTDSNGTVWRLYRSTYPGSYTAAGVTLS